MFKIWRKLFLVSLLVNHFCSGGGILSTSLGIMAKAYIVFCIQQFLSSMHKMPTVTKTEARKTEWRRAAMKFSRPKKQMFTC